ncbi:hypothetical protein [Pseudooceanicola sp. MF1-13]|uniref:hypothetical protein n=1 Tax=Pseudooceanicola sp. MF1-13 TaxID=3379095 RepID=UPI0038928A44
MTRKILATVLAAALSITSINVSTAQAGDRDAVRIIVGATALAIIGSALAAEQRKKQTVTRNYNHQPQHNYQQRHQQNRYNNHYQKPRHQKPQTQHRRVSVPRNCLMTVRGQRGWTEGYAVRCAQRGTRATLPSDCVRRNYAQGPRLFYAPRCLRRNGFNA